MSLFKKERKVIGPSAAEIKWREEQAENARAAAEKAVLEDYGPPLLDDEPAGWRWDYSGETADMPHNGPITWGSRNGHNYYNLPYEYYAVRGMTPPCMNPELLMNERLDRIESKLDELLKSRKRR